MYLNYWEFNKFLFILKLILIGFFNYLGGFWSGIIFCVFLVIGVVCVNGLLELNVFVIYLNSDIF